MNGSVCEVSRTAGMKDIVLWRLGQVDGELHTLEEAAFRFGLSIQQIALGERELTTTEEEV
jgi:hypothetical protein